MKQLFSCRQWAAFLAGAAYIFAINQPVTVEAIGGAACFGAVALALEAIKRERVS